MSKVLIKIAFLSLTSINFACSRMETSSGKGEELQKLIKQENFSQIYQDSSSCMRNNYSEQELIVVVKEAVEKLKSVDRNLEFVDYDYGEKGFDDKWVEYQNYGIGYESFKTSRNSNESQNLKPKGERSAMILTAWQRDEDLKLTSFQVLVGEYKTAKWYGTSACKTTEREGFIGDGANRTRTTIVTEPIR